jgi:hypothetical protein
LCFFTALETLQKSESIYWTNPIEGYLGSLLSVQGFIYQGFNVHNNKVFKVVGGLSGKLIFQIMARVATFTTNLFSNSWLFREVG